MEIYWQSSEDFVSLKVFLIPTGNKLQFSMGYPQTGARVSSTSSGGTGRGLLVTPPGLIKLKTVMHVFIDRACLNFKLLCQVV